MAEEAVAPKALDNAELLTLPPADEVAAPAPAPEAAKPVAKKKASAKSTKRIAKTPKSTPTHEVVVITPEQTAIVVQQPAPEPALTVVTDPGAPLDVVAKYPANDKDQVVLAVKKKNFSRSAAQQVVVETPAASTVTVTKVEPTAPVKKAKEERSMWSQMADDVFGIEPRKPEPQPVTVEVVATQQPIAAPKKVEGIFLQPDKVVVSPTAPVAPTVVKIAPAPAPTPVALEPIKISPQNVIISRTPPQAKPVQLEVAPVPAPVVATTVTVAPAPEAKKGSGTDALKENVHNVMDDVFGVEAKETPSTTVTVAAPTSTAPATTQVTVAPAQAEATTVTVTTTQPVTAPALVHWKAARGQTLREALQGWCDQAQVQLYWNTNYDYPLQTGLDIENTFEGAVSTVLEGFEKASPKPIGRLYRQSKVAQNVLIIETHQESK